MLNSLELDGDPQKEVSLVIKCLKEIPSDNNVEANRMQINMGG